MIINGIIANYKTFFQIREKKGQSGHFKDLL